MGDNDDHHPADIIDAHRVGPGHLQVRQPARFIERIHGHELKIPGRDGAVRCEELAEPLVLGVVGIMLCVNWQRLIRNYRQLNAAKFEVIHEFERHLPAAPFAREWVVLGKGEEAAKYTPISKTEAMVATAMQVLYLVAVVAGFILWNS